MSGGCSMRLRTRSMRNEATSLGLMPRGDLMCGMRAKVVLVATVELRLTGFLVPLGCLVQAKLPTQMLLMLMHHRFGDSDDNRAGWLIITVFGRAEIDGIRLASCKLFSEACHGEWVRVQCEILKNERDASFLFPLNTRALFRTHEESCVGTSCISLCFFSNTRQKDLLC
jgi:hypothetical protein